MNLEKKIDELFELRRIPELLSLGTSNLREQKLVLIRLKRIQQVIYELDHYLETHWTTDIKALQKHWQSIYDALQGLHVKLHNLEPQILHIRKYQEHELNLRSNNMPTKLKMRYFYYYKSCDVRLMRSVIYHRFPNLTELSSLSDWDQYDLVTEVHDDIEDLYEDLHSINANRFMIHLYTDGPNQTKRIYADFLDKVEIESELKQLKSPINDEIFRWTQESLSNCRNLLQQQILNFNPSKEITPKLMTYFKGQTVA